MYLVNTPKCNHCRAIAVVPFMASCHCFLVAPLVGSIDDAVTFETATPSRCRVSCYLVFFFACHRLILVIIANGSVPILDVGVSESTVTNDVSPRSM